MKEAVDHALRDGVPVVVAYVAPGGQPSLSLRGSTQVYGPAQLAIWVRDPSGGMLAGIARNPKIALLYRNPATRQSWQFRGRARVDDDQAVRRRVYDSSPEPERDRDPERRGVALLVDLDRVIERGQSIMER